MSRGRRVLRFVVILVSVLAALVSASAVANALVTSQEKADLKPYGQLVPLDTGHINVYRNGGSGQTLVLLSGYGTATPALDFAPLIRQLGSFNVLVIEGFGYGYSDLDVPDRTVENITSEVHEVLDRLGVQRPFVLVGHSLGGMYARYYANAYPGEIAGVVGIDPTPAKASTLEVDSVSVIDGLLNRIGLIRWVTTLVPDLVEPTGTGYTDSERRQIAAMNRWNYGNPSLADERSRIAANSTRTSARPFPRNTPVLQFLATQTIDSNPAWRGEHEAELAAVRTHQLVVVEGGHYLHWTQTPLLAATIADFVAAHVPD